MKPCAHDLKYFGWAGHVRDGVAGVASAVCHRHQKTVCQKQVRPDVFVQPTGGIDCQVLNSSGGTGTGEVGQHVVKERVTKAEFGAGRGDALMARHKLTVADDVA